jgi:Sec34-like family
MHFHAHRAECLHTTTSPVLLQYTAAHTQRVEQLSSFDEQCAEFEQQVSRAVALLEAIRAAQEQVSAKTSSLHSTCERLLTEERVSSLLLSSNDKI